jgi:hypothetical protein
LVDERDRASGMPKLVEVGLAEFGEHPARGDRLLGRSETSSSLTVGSVPVTATVPATIARGTMRARTRTSSR